MYNVFIGTDKSEEDTGFRRGHGVGGSVFAVDMGGSQAGKVSVLGVGEPDGLSPAVLGKPPLTFDPCDYGDPYTKKTDLWGYYNEPKKKPVKLDAETIARLKINNRKLPSISDFTGSKQSARRAITPAGFSEAFYKANP